MNTNRNSLGQFSKTHHIKGFLILVTLVLLVVAGFTIFNNHFMAWADANIQPMSYTATTTEPTRLQQTQALIDNLAEQRTHDPSFIAETKKEQQELNDRRVAQARIDALTIVRTQLEMEIDALDKSTQ